LATSSSGIDPLIQLYRAGATETVIASNDDRTAGTSDASVVMATSTDGWYLIVVQNQAPGSMQGRTYTVSVRSSAAPSNTAPTATVTATPLGDAFENNWRVADAPRLAWGVPYDLSLVCPEPAPACRSGDHDFFRVPVKQGVPFVALTYDLGPAADTTMTLYQPMGDAVDPSTGLAGWHMLVGNDDARSGITLRSQVLINPTWTGDALLIIAPAERTDPAAIPAAVGPPGRYRLIVGSPFFPAVQQVLAAQAALEGTTATAPVRGEREDTNLSPTPVAPLGPTVLPVTPVPGDTEEIIREACVTGIARVINPQGARFSAAAVPAHSARLLMLYPQDTEVVLLGSCYLGWVKVRPTMAVSPGWMFAPDLVLVEATGNAAAPIEAPSNQEDGADPAQASNTQSAVPTPNNLLPTAKPLDIMALPTSMPSIPSVAPRQALTVAVSLITPTDQPRAGVRVQLIDVLGTVLREGVTDATGQITLVVDLPAQAAVWVQIPAAGLQLAVDRTQPTLVMTIPGGTA
jgi:hypothetical protein